MRSKINLVLKNYNFIIFDCDGTLLKSNKIKSELFRDALIKYDQRDVQKFIEYHQLNGGISRFIKFQYFFQEILKLNNYSAELNEVLNQFSKLAFQKLKKASLIPGIYEFLEILLQHDIKLIVASGAEEKELRKILKEHDLEKYFSYIGGSPNSKEEIVKKFIDHNASLKIKGLVFGDSISDLRVAENFDFDFIFIEEESEWSNHLDYINIARAKKVKNYYQIDLKI